MARLPKRVRLLLEAYRVCGKRPPRWLRPPKNVNTEKIKKGVKDARGRHIDR